MERGAVFFSVETCPCCNVDSIWLSNIQGAAPPNETCTEWLILLDSCTLLSCYKHCVKNW